MINSALAAGLRELVREALPWPLQRMSVTIGHVGPAPESAAQGGVLWRNQGGRFWFRMPDTARYLVEDGERLTIEPFPAADERVVARFAASTPAAAAFMQRGLPVLNAAVAAGPHGAVVLAGDSGAGKSVLLALLIERGWRLISDDMAVLRLDDDGRVRVQPTGGEVRLWPDSTRIELPRCGDTAPYLTSPLEISTIWLLGVANEPGLRVTGVSGIERFSQLTHSAYNTRIAAAVLDRQCQFTVLGGLAASTVPIHSLVRANEGWTADEMTDVIVSHER